jgi:threonine synthase
VAWRSFLTHLQCSACGARHDADQPQTVCRQCGLVLFARYDQEAVKRAVNPADFAGRGWDMWLRAAGFLSGAENVVLFNTGMGIKYPPPV